MAKRFKVHYVRPSDGEWIFRESFDDELTLMTYLGRMNRSQRKDHQVTCNGQALRADQYVERRLLDGQFTFPEFRHITGDEVETRLRKALGKPKDPAIAVGVATLISNTRALIDLLHSVGLVVAERTTSPAEDQPTG